MAESIVTESVRIDVRTPDDMTSEDIEDDEKGKSEAGIKVNLTLQDSMYAQKMLKFAAYLPVDMKNRLPKLAATINQYIKQQTIVKKKTLAKQKTIKLNSINQNNSDI